MATVASVSLKAAMGMKASSAPCYRRSTTSKRTVVNRKRYFVTCAMEKHSPGVRSAGAGSTITKASAAGNAEVLQACCGGDNNDMRGRGAGMGGNGGRPPRSGDSSNNNAGGSEQPLPRALVLGAVTLVAALVLLPSQQAAASGPGFPRAVRVAGASSGSSATANPASPRSMCLNHSLPRATLSEGAILYGQVQLTEAERRLLARSSRQIFFSEYVRVGSGAAGRM